MKNRRGLIIVLDGNHGTGKTTVIKKLHRIINKLGINCVIHKEDKQTTQEQYIEIRENQLKDLLRFKNCNYVVLVDRYYLSTLAESGKLDDKLKNHIIKCSEIVDYYYYLDTDDYSKTCQRLKIRDGNCDYEKLVNDGKKYYDAYRELYYIETPLNLEGFCREPKKVVMEILEKVLKWYEFI